MLILLVLLPVFAAVVQLGLALYVRNTLAACAQEGARYGSAEDLVTRLDDAAVDAAENRTRGCIDGALTNRYSREVTAGLAAKTLDGATVPVVRVEVAGPVPVFGLFGLGDDTLRVSGAAVQELP